MAGADHPAGGRAQRRPGRPRRRGIRTARLLRVGHRDADHRRPRRDGNPADQLPHHRPLLAHPVLPPHRPEPPPQRARQGRRPRRRLPGIQRRGPEGERVPLGDPPPPRLRHLRGGQVAPLPRGRDQHGRATPQLAPRPRLRPLVRLPRWRDPPVRADPLPGQPLDRPARLRRRGVSPDADLADQAITYLADLRSVDPERRFFLYFCTGACHSPHHAPREWIERYRGHFDQGWDAWRESAFARQMAEGFFPAGAEFAPRPHWVPAWDDLPAEQQRRRGSLHGVLRGVPLLHRRAARAAVRLSRADRRSRRHAGDAGLGQRRERRGRGQRFDQRQPPPERRPRRTERVVAPDRRDRRSERAQQLPLGLDDGRQHPVPSLEDARCTRAGWPTRAS